MSFIAHISLDRSERLALGRIGTLRDPDQRPLDVEVDNISHTGCLFRHDGALPTDSIVMLGIPGIGRHRARIRRTEEGRYGCEFIIPITTSDLAKAQSADTVIEAVSTWAVEPKDVAEAAPQPETIHSPRRKAAIIVGASLFLWGAIIGAGYAVLAFIG